MSQSAPPAQGETAPRTRPSQWNVKKRTRLQSFPPAPHPRPPRIGSNCKCYGTGHNPQHLFFCVPPPPTSEKTTYLSTLDPKSLVGENIIKVPSSLDPKTTLFAGKVTDNCGNWCTQTQKAVFSPKSW
eukprot:gene13349-biopygen12551